MKYRKVTVTLKYIDRAFYEEGVYEVKINGMYVGDYDIYNNRGSFDIVSPLTGGVVTRVLNVSRYTIKDTKGVKNHIKNWVKYFADPKFYCKEN